MDGTIAIESRPGVGSNVLVNLRLQKAEAISPAATVRLQPANHPDLAHLRVLAAEDNTVNQILLRELLSPHVAALDIVEDGESAIEAAARRDYDAVLMDVQLPGVDGVTATQEIRRLSATWAQRPIIALTANAMSDQQAAYLDAGMTACLSKPIDFEHLCAVLAEIGRGKGEPGDATPAKPMTPPSPGDDKSRTMMEQESPRGDRANKAQPDHPLVDEGGLDQLVAIIGADSVASLLQQLKLQFADSIQKIEDARDVPEAMAALAHTLAGAAGNCQAVRVSKIARTLEGVVAEHGDPGETIALLHGAVGLTLDAIDAYVAAQGDAEQPSPRRMFAAK
jgi:CheY-like chemotaxis protein